MSKNAITGYLEAAARRAAANAGRAILDRVARSTVEHLLRQLGYPPAMIARIIDDAPDVMATLSVDPSDPSDPVTPL